jgi:hypothetical protein
MNDSTSSPVIFLINQGNHANRVAESVAQGGEAYMTSENMYYHLNMLENLVPRTVRLYSGSCSPSSSLRATIERGGRSPMDRRHLLSGVDHVIRQYCKSMVLNFLHHIPSIGISVPSQKRSLRISGTVNYAAFTTDPPKHGVSFLSVYLIVLKPL